MCKLYVLVCNITDITQKWCRVAHWNLDRKSNNLFKNKYFQNVVSRISTILSMNICPSTNDWNSACELTYRRRHFNHSISTVITWHHQSLVGDPNEVTSHNANIGYVRIHHLRLTNYKTSAQPDKNTVLQGIQEVHRISVCNVSVVNTGETNIGEIKHGLSLKE